MSGTPSQDACPECGATAAAPIGTMGPAGFVGGDDPIPEHNREVAVCAQCGATLERALLGGPHPWDRAE